MGVKLGEIDAVQIIDNEFKIKLILRLLDWILDNNQLNRPTQEMIIAMRTEIINELREKYPNSDIRYIE